MRWPSEFKMPHPAQHVTFEEYIKAVDAVTWVSRFLTKKLKLVVNETKSRVVKTNDLHFLGFTFRGKKVRWSDKALKDFKHRVRRLTKRSWGFSMQRRLRELRLYIQGWINYFGLSEYYRPLPRLDE